MQAEYRAGGRGQPGRPGQVAHAADHPRFWRAEARRGGPAAAGVRLRLDAGAGLSGRHCLGVVAGAPGGGPARGGKSEGRLTILLAQYNQPGKMQLAGALQARARKVLGSNDVWLQNGELGLAVNYGHFETDSQAKRGLAGVKKIYGQLEPGPWQFCYIMEIPDPDPPAPKQWDLLKSNCDYSLEIGTYYDVPEKNYYNRKADALKAVTDLRQDGEAAFFVHGRLHSRVYVGCLSSLDFGKQWENGIQRTTPSPSAKKLRSKHPFYHENGYKIYDISYDDNGKKVRTQRKSRFIKLDIFGRDRRQMPF